MQRTLLLTSMAALAVASACGKKPDSGLGYTRPLPASADELEDYYRSLLDEPSCLRNVPSGTFFCETFSFVPCRNASVVATPVGAVPAACVQEIERPPRGPVDRWCLVGRHVEPSPDRLIDSQEALRAWCGGHSWIEGGFARASCSPERPQSLDASEPTETQAVPPRSDPCLLFPFEETMRACQAAFCG